MLRNIILDSGAVANGIDVAKGRATETEVRVCLKSMSVRLNFELFGNTFAEVGLC